MKQSGVYKIENRLDRKLYIGSAINIRRRWETHRRLLDAQAHPNAHLQRAWDRDGADVFAFAVLELVKDKALLVEREQAAIELYRSNEMVCGYNLRRHARSNLGIVPEFSEVSRLAAAERMRKVGLQRGAWMQSPEGRAFMSAIQRGRKWTPEERAQMSTYRKANPNAGCFKGGHQQNGEIRQKIVAARKGKSLSAKAHANVAAANQRKALLLTPEDRKAIGDRFRIINTGRRHTPETLFKLSESHKGKSHSMPSHTEEWKQHHSEQLKGRPQPKKRQFTDDQVVEIRNLRVSGLSFGNIGKQFGVSASRIFKIVKGLVYAQPVIVAERAGGGK